MLNAPKCSLPDTVCMIKFIASVWFNLWLWFALYEEVCESMWNLRLLCACIEEYSRCVYLIVHLMLLKKLVICDWLDLCLKFMNCWRRLRVCVIWLLNLGRFFQDSDLSEFEKNVGPSWPKLVEPLEKMMDKLTVVWGAVNHLKAVKDTTELRSAIEEIQVWFYGFKLI